MWVPISTLTPERLQERRELLNSTFYSVGSSFVGLTKSAGTAKPTYALAGRLVGSESGWVLLKVPNALVRGAFDAIHEPGVEPPDDLNAHISVMRPEELEQIGGMDKITERGHFFRYQLGQVKEVVPAGQSDMSKCWFIQVKSPELEKLRKSYGLTAKPKDNQFDFHITIAYRKKNVFREVAEGKAASFLKLPQFLAQEKDAKHIVITGHSGAGKTELAKLIHDETGLPVKSLDKDKLWRKSKVKDDPERYEAGTKAFDKFHRLRKKMTDHALKLKKPHILEGCQLMADPKRLEPHLAILVDTPKDKVIEQRLHRDKKDGKVERDGVSARIAKAVDLFEGLNGEVKKLKKSPRVHKVRFEWKVETESKTAAEKKTCTIAVDLDGTICEWHGAHVDGKFGELREGAVETMKEWKDAGHRILIWTSRDDMGDVRKWLADNKVPYDEINRDSEGPPSSSPKVIAHVYVDDRAVNARRDWAYIKKQVEAQIEAGNNKIPLPMIGHYEPKQKLKRDVFLYQDPKGVDNKFAQCSTCHDYTGSSCENFAKGNTVAPTGSCGLYHFGKGSDRLQGKEMGTFTKQEAGYVDRQVRCENCAFFDDDKSYCELYEKLNKEWPHVFSLKEDVDKHGCCNAQVARDEKAKEAMEAINPAMFADDLMAILARRRMQRARASKPQLPSALQPPLTPAPVAAPPVEEKQGFDLKQTFQDPMFGVDFQGGSGKNIVDRMEDYAKQQAQWDASTIGAQGDRPVYHRTLRGLANILKLKPSDEAIHHATGDIAKVAPYATAFVPGVWDALHGPRGSTANLARNFSASGQVSPLDAAGMASSMKLGAEHGHRAVTVENRDGCKVLCPHCNCELTSAATYKDAKGWVFCRACFRKGKGAIRMPEKQGSSLPTASIIQRMFPQATGVNPVLAHLNSQHATPRQDVTRQIGVGTKVVAPPIVGGRPAPTKVPNPELMDAMQSVYNHMLPKNPEYAQGGVLPHPFDKSAVTARLVSRAITGAAQQGPERLNQMTGAVEKWLPGSMMRARTPVSPPQMPTEMLTANKLSPEILSGLNQAFGSNVKKVDVVGHPRDAYAQRHRDGSSSIATTSDLPTVLHEFGHTADPDLVGRDERYPGFHSFRPAPRAELIGERLANRNVLKNYHKLPVALGEALPPKADMQKLLRQQREHYELGQLQKMTGMRESPSMIMPSEYSHFARPAAAAIAGPEAAPASAMPVWKKEPSTRGGNFMDDVFGPDEMAKPKLLAAQPKPVAGLQVKKAAFKVAPSQIHGQGVFTDTDMNAGDDFGLALEALPQAKPGQPAFKRSDLGRFLNHADDANAELYSAGGGMIHVRAIKPIEKANEVTVHYPSGMACQQQVHGEKRGFSGALGSGAESGQSVTSPPRLMDGSGATPTGAENQPVKDIIHPDEAEIAVDDPMFDLASLKIGTDNFMSSAVGPEDAVGNDQGVQWTAKLNRTPMLPAAIASAYQNSGTIESAGASSKPTGAGVPERGGGYGSTAGPLSAPVVRDPVTEVSGSSAPMQGLPFTMGIG